MNRYILLIVVLTCVIQLRPMNNNNNKRVHDDTQEGNSEKKQRIDENTDISTINNKNINNELLEAVIKNDLDKVQKILSSGNKNINLETARNEIGDNSDDTLLITAVKNNNSNMIKLLIKSGANILTVSGESNTALNVACDRGYYDIVKILVEDYKVPFLCFESLCINSPLYCAARAGHYKIVDFLIVNGANVNKLWNGELVLLDELLDNLDDNELDLDEYNDKNNILISLEILIKNGAMVREGKSIDDILLYIIEKGSYYCSSIVKLLLDMGASINIRNNSLLELVDFEFQKKRRIGDQYTKKFIKLLMFYGVDPMIKNEKNQKPLDIPIIAVAYDEYNQEILDNYIYITNPLIINMINEYFVKDLSNIILEYSKPNINDNIYETPYKMQRMLYKIIVSSIIDNQQYSSILDNKDKILKSINIASNLGKDNDVCKLARQLVNSIDMKKSRLSDIVLSYI